MNFKKNILYLLLFKPSFVFFMAFILFCFAIKSMLENEIYLQQYDILNDNVIDLSSLAERLKMKRNSNTVFSSHSSGGFKDGLITLLNENSIAFKITDLQKESILVNIESADSYQFLNVFLILSQDERIEVSNVNITIDKDGGYISGDIVLLNKL
ncbi:Uncharacterised protein [Yersinia kristensenii]|nr:Uncharacterised protein [Yersinia kristensenii]